MQTINIALLVLCILSGLTGMAYLGFNSLAKWFILKRLVISNTSHTFESWKSPPVSPHLKVFFFNISNPVQVFDGLEKPHLIEMGPYTYRQKWIKQNITFNTNGTISYKTRKIFTFSPTESCAGCSDVRDQVTTLNVPAISAYHHSRGASWLGKNALDIGIRHALGYRPWVRRPIYELLWGYEENLFKTAQYLLPDPPPFDRFGLFMMMNSSQELGEFNMFTGEGNPDMLASIYTFNHRRELGFWNGSKCNAVRGSEGAFFKPYIKKTETLWFFSDRLCRSLPLVYHKSITVKPEGLPGLRFVPRQDVFMSAERFPEENSCFTGKDRVSGDGVFDLRACQFDSPIVLSWPHFLGAEERFTGAVTGLNPEHGKHGFWFDIQAGDCLMSQKCMDFKHQQAPILVWCGTF